MARVATLSTLATPTGFGGVESATAGNLPARTYYYKIIALYGGGSGPSSSTQKRSAPSSEINVVNTTANKSIDLSWNAVSGATGYIVWRTLVSGDYENAYKPGGNKFNCKALRTTYSVYSTTGTTLNDNASSTGIQQATATYQSLYHYMYLDFAVPRINISGGDVTDSFSMEYLYQQDLSNGWGVITRTGDVMIGYTYEVKAHIYASSAIYWKEEYYPNTWILWAGFYSSNSGSTVLLGYESATEEWAYGVRFIILGHFGYYSFPNSQFSGNSSLYDCSFHIRNHSYEGYTLPVQANSMYGMQAGGMSIGFSHNYTLKGCRFKGAPWSTRFDGGGTFLVERCDLSIGGRTFALGGGDFSTGEFKDVYIKDNSQGINCERRTATLRGGKVIAGTYTIFIAFGDAYLTLVGVDFDDTKIYWYQGQSVSPGAKLDVKEEFDITVLNPDGTAISGATVTVKNKDDTEQFSLSTDANGEITSQDVLRLFCTPANNTNHAITADEKTNYNPFTLEIKKAGYKTYKNEFTIDSSIDWTIALQLITINIDSEVIS